jgi:hypothetical protein
MALAGERDNHAMTGRHVQRLLLHHHDGMLVGFLSRQLAIGVLLLDDDVVVRLELLFFQLGGSRSSFGGYSLACALLDPVLLRHHIFGGLLRLRLLLPGGGRGRRGGGRGMHGGGIHRFR